MLKMPLNVGIKETAIQIKDILSPKSKAEQLKTLNAKAPVTSTYSTGMITKADKQIFGQMTRSEYLNEFIELWREDYVAKARCVCFLAAAVVSWSAFAPFSLLCIALAAKWWDWALWNRNISRFNGIYRNVSLMQ